jgi:hypothetical protein
MAVKNHFFFLGEDETAIWVQEFYFYFIFRALGSVNGIFQEC